MLARKVDAQRWEAQNEAANHCGAWVDPAGGKVKGGNRPYAGTSSRQSKATRLSHPCIQEAVPAPYSGKRS